MDYEKKYKEALSRAATELETCGADKSLRNMIYAIFPDELKESEDEKIRKALVRFHKSTIDIDGIKGADILAWLEKQGEQKPFDYEHATITQKDFAPKPTEWSDEDENYLQSAENACEYQYGKNTSTILWLKSLKDRVKGKED